MSRMTREENLHWLNEEIRTWENECQSKHPIKEALYAARKALEQEPILEKDGTLIVTTEHCENVGRVLVQYGTNGALFYQGQDSTTKNDLGDDCVRRKAVLNTLERMDKVLDEDRTADSYKELLKECYKVLPSVTPQEPKTGYISIDDVMSVFDDFMRGEVDEEGTETFFEMLKDKTESEAEDGNDK